MSSKEKILCLDDSKIIRVLVIKMLNEGGFTDITQVGTIQEAKDAFEKEKFDIALLDYNIDADTSDILLDFIKTKYPDTIVIMLSGQMDRNIVVKLMRKADDYVIKEEGEALKEELLFTIDNCVKLRDLRIQNTNLMNEIQNRNDELKKQLNNAQTLLKEIFPKNINPSDVFGIKVIHRSWEVIGGDFYHIDKLTGKKTGIIIADIAGHGIQSALLLFTLSNAYRDTISSGNISSKEAVASLNANISRQFPESTYVTCCFLILDEENKKVQFSSAFENPIIFLRNKTEVSEVTNGKIGMIGLDFIGTNGEDFFEESTLEINNGDKMFLFTDGIVEITNNQKEPFGLERIKKTIRDNGDKSLEIILKALYQSVITFSSKVFKDDITIIGIERKL